MAYASKATESINWDEKNYEAGKLGRFYEGTYVNKDAQITPFSVLSVGEEMIESILRDMKVFVEPKLSIFLNTDKKGKQFLSFKVAEKFVKSVVSKSEQEKIEAKLKKLEQAEKEADEVKDKEIYDMQETTV